MIDAIAGLIGGEQAEDAQAASNRAARKLLQQNIDEAYTLTGPARQIGGSALDSLAGLYGLGGRPQSFDAFTASPDYQFNLQEGLKSLGQSAASRGGLYSGQAMKEAQRYGSGLASQQFSDFFNRISGLADRGERATTNLLNVRTGGVSDIGNLMQQQGQNRGKMISGQWQGFGDLASSLAGAAIGGLGGGGGMGALKGMFGM